MRSRVTCVLESKRWYGLLIWGEKHYEGLTFPKGSLQNLQYGRTRFSCKFHGLFKF